MNRVFLIAVTFSLVCLNACSASTEGAKKGSERAMLSDTDNSTEVQDETVTKRTFKTRHGVSGLIRQRLQGE